MEILKAIKAIANTDNFTILELRTNKGKRNVRLPYAKVEGLQGTKYNYSMGIIEYCKLHNIGTYNYLYGHSWEV